MDDPKSPPNKSDAENSNAASKFFRWILSPFVSTTDQEVTKYLGDSATPAKVKKSGLYDFDFVNLLLGGSWGVISGYTSEVFFTRVPDKYKFLSWVGSLSKINFIRSFATRNWIYPAFVAIRITNRTILSALLFDQTERRVAQIFGVSKTYSVLAGFTVLSFFFKLSTDIRDAAIATSVALGGYLVGSQFAKAVDQYKNPSRNSVTQQESNDRNDK